jgi:hypothetical protein
MLPFQSLRFESRKVSFRLDIELFQTLSISRMFANLIICSLVAFLSPLSILLKIAYQYQSELILLEVKTLSFLFFSY